MSQGFMDVLKKQTAQAPNARVYRPAPEVLPEGPCRVLLIEEVFIYGELIPAGKEIVLRNAAKDFARTRIDKGGSRTVVIDGKQHTTKFNQNSMVFLEDLTPGYVTTPPAGTQGAGKPAAEQANQKL